MDNLGDIQNTGSHFLWDVFHTQTSWLCFAFFFLPVQKHHKLNKMIYIVIKTFFFFLSAIFCEWEREAVGILLASVIATGDSRLTAKLSGILLEQAKISHRTSLLPLHVFCIFFPPSGLFTSSQSPVLIKKLFLALSIRDTFPASVCLSWTCTWKRVSSLSCTSSYLPFWNNSKFVSVVELYERFLETAWMNDTIQNKVQLLTDKPFLTQRLQWEFWQRSPVSA